MRRLVAVVIASAVVASSTMAGSLHVHRYVGHDHPDHHHGPARHEHEHRAFTEPDHHSVAENDHEPVIGAGSCDAGRHAVGVRIGCASVPQMFVDLAELPGPIIVTPIAPVRAALPVTDIRVHGPPSNVRIPSRAPPVTAHS